MLICQITDLHIRAHGESCYGRVDTSTALRDCVASIRALPQTPDVVVATGDLVDTGSAADYLALADILTGLDLPLYLLPGNHDERGALCAAFPDHHYLATGTARLNYVIDDHPLRLIALDTVIPGDAAGQVDGDSLAWLDRVLASAPHRPAMLMMHHPPFLTGIVAMDEIGLAGRAQLESVVARHPQLERIICGHLHRSISTRFGATVASTCPSTAHQVYLDFAAQAAACFTLEPPGYQLHWWRAGQSLVSHTLSIGKFPGPYHFE